MPRLSPREFRTLVQEAIDSLPDQAKRRLVNVVVDVEPEADEDLLRELGFTEEEIADGADLFGLFAPMPGFTGQIGDPRRIIIFQRPHEEVFADPQTLREEIRKTVLHELHHHFGYSERDIDEWTDLA
jgi:predicted Zn-dependent protease with MMP-like domain